jgi:hypothetical protein
MKMIGKIFLSCGHEDFYRPISGWPLKIKDYDTFDDGQYGKCITYHTLCKDCYVDYIEKFPETVIFDPWEEEEWFNEGDD